MLYVKGSTKYNQKKCEYLFNALIFYSLIYSIILLLFTLIFSLSLGKNITKSNETRCAQKYANRIKDVLLVTKVESIYSQQKKVYAIYILEVSPFVK